MKNPVKEIFDAWYPGWEKVNAVQADLNNKGARRKIKEFIFSVFEAGWNAGLFVANAEDVHKKFYLQGFEDGKALAKN